MHLISTWSPKRRAVRSEATADYSPPLDAMRAGSIMLVILGHAGLGDIIPGGFGVTVFFFISGLLISQLLLKEVDRTGTISLSRFYVRRFLRLVPALYLYIPMAVLLFTGLGFFISPLYCLSALTYWVNYYILYFPDAHASFGDFPYTDVWNPLAVLWSLGIEEHFYLLFPCLLLLFRRHRRGFAWTLVGLCAAALIWRYHFYAAHCVDGLSESCVWAEDHNYRASDTRFDSLLFGVMATLFLATARDKFVRLIGNPLVLGTALLVLFFSFAIRDPGFRATFRYSLQGLALLAVIPAILHLATAAPLRSLMSWPPLLYVGRISYALYLFHWGARNFASFAAAPFSWQWYAIFIPAALIPTVLCYHFLELPVIGLRRRFGSTIPQAAVPRAATETAPAAYGWTPGESIERSV